MWGKQVCHNRLPHGKCTCSPEGCGLLQALHEELLSLGVETLHRDLATMGPAEILPVDWCDL